jgi:hypothetical protein
MGLWSSGGAPGGGWRGSGAVKLGRNGSGSQGWCGDRAGSPAATGTGRELELRCSWRVTAMWSSADTDPVGAPPCALSAPHHAWDV